MEETPVVTDDGSTRLMHQIVRQCLTDNEKAISVSRPLIYTREEISYSESNQIHFHYSTIEYMLKTGIPVIVKIH